MSNKQNEAVVICDICIIVSGGRLLTPQSSPDKCESFAAAQSNHCPAVNTGGIMHSLGNYIQGFHFPPTGKP